MKARRIYYRKKGKSIAIEGKSKGKSISIFTLPKPEKLIDALFRRQKVFTKPPLNKQKEASNFTKEKYNKIMQKVRRLDYKKNKDDNNA